MMLCDLQLKTLQTENYRRLQSENDGKKKQEKRVEELEVMYHCMIIT